MQPSGALPPDDDEESEEAAALAAGASGTAAAAGSAKEDKSVAGDVLLYATRFRHSDAAEEDGVGA